MAETLSAIISRALALAALLVTAAVPASAEAARGEVGAPADPAPIVQPGSGAPTPDAPIAGPSTATAADPTLGSSTTVVHSG